MIDPHDSYENKDEKKPSVVAHACSPSTLQVEAGGLGVQAYVQRDTGDTVSNKKELSKR